MKIGIVSDSHGRRPALSAALAELRQRGITTVLHCGDVEDTATVALFRGFDAHFVHGNCDHDRDQLQSALEAVGARYHGAWGTLALAGRTLAFLHGDDGRQMDELLASKAFDFLFHGHTHRPRDELIGSTRVINPGALHRAQPKTFVVLDLACGAAESILVG